MWLLLGSGILILMVYLGMYIYYSGEYKKEVKNENKQNK